MTPASTRNSANVVTRLGRAIVRLIRRSEKIVSPSQSLVQIQAAPAQHRVSRFRLLRWLFTGLLLLGASQSVLAGTDFCSDYPVNANGYHVIDGNDPALTVLTLPSSIGIDANCYFTNFPQSAKWPNGLTSTLNFKFDGYLAIFDGVYYSGNMACSNTTTHIWFVNGGAYNPNNSCQDLFIPTETIGKAIPGPTASIGVPFTYTLTVPVLYDLSTDTYYNSPSANTLSNATIYDDLTATGAALTYVSNTAYLIDGSGVKTSIGSLTLGATPATLTSLGIPVSDATKHLVFSSDYNSVLTNIAAGTQVEIQLTVMLDNVAGNTDGTQFTNTAQWWFGRVIDGVAYEPLPGQAGVSQPMTIASPSLIMTKSAPVTNVNVGDVVPYTLDMQNNGGGYAWNTTVTDNIPTGMCNYNPTTDAGNPITARVYAADGTTAVSPALTAGTDFTVSWGAYSNAAYPDIGCQLILNMTSANAKIGPTQRLIITYPGKLDATSTTGTYTNVAGATQWFNGDSSAAGPHSYSNTLTTDGSPATTDFEDSFTINAVTSGYYFLKTGQDVTTGQLEDATNGLSAFPGDTIRYTLQVQNFNIPALNNITITDDLSSSNFVMGSMRLVSASTTDGTGFSGSPSFSPSVGSSSATNQLNITGLNLRTDEQITIVIEVTLSSSLSSGTVVYNHATMTGTDTSSSTTKTDDSDDPFISGPVQWGIGATRQDTPLTIQKPDDLSKTNPATTTWTIGDTFTYQIKVPATPVSIPLYDVKISDFLASSNVDMTFVSASVVSGGSWSLVNTGTSTAPVLEDQSTGIDIPPGGQAVIDVTVKLSDTTKNVAGVTFTNSATYSYNTVNGNTATLGTTNTVTTTPAMTVVEPALGSASKTVTDTSNNPISGPVSAGQVLKYTVSVTNNGTSTAYDTSVIDYLPSNTSLVAGSATATINGVAVTGFIVDPTVTPAGALAWGYQNGDGSLDIPVGQTLVLTYQATVLAANGTDITNGAYIDWSSVDAGVTGERTGDGCGTTAGTTAPDTYCIGPYTATVSATDPTTLAKTVVSDTWTTLPSNATDGFVRIGDTVVFNLAMTLREGTTDNVVLTDTLPAGLVYDGTYSITPASGSNFTYSVTSAPAAGSTGSISWNLGSITNAVDNDLTNNTLNLQFRVRVADNLTDLPLTPLTQTLTNNASLAYSIGGTAATPKTSSTTIDVRQPQLSVSKTVQSTAGGDSVVDANELVTYQVDITNNGTATAYNPILQDTLPVGMRNSGITVVDYTILSSGKKTSDIVPTYNATTGVAVWNFDNGTANDYAIVPGDTLRVVYRVTTDATLGTGLILQNSAYVQHYYSFDSADVPTGSVLANRREYGASSASTTTLTTAAAMALSKSTTYTQVAVGQPFTYTITIPATTQTTALYDVKVTDDISLATTGVSLAFVSASAQLESGTQTWASLTNSGTATSLILEDTAGGGLDVPANDRLLVTVTLVLTDDMTNNTPGKSFSNTADYWYNKVNDDNATVDKTPRPGTSNTSTIIAPVLAMDKTGPATMYLGTTDTFTLDLHNTGGATAWNTVITDLLPNKTTAPTASMCSTAPTIVDAGIYDAAGTTLITALNAGTDFNVSFNFTAGASTCTLTITMLTAATAIPAGDHLIVHYNATLDAVSPGVSMTNIAGATQYQSADPSVTGAGSNVHTYNNTLTDGTTGDMTDFQDAFTVSTGAPSLTFTKDVYDVTTSSPGTTANPGDTLRYTLTINNTGTVDSGTFSLSDDLDALNTTARFVPNTLAITSILPAGAVNNSNPTGGSKNTGLVSISNLSVAAGSSVSIVFTVRLVPVITNGTVVLNQATIDSSTISAQSSDDPNTATADDPTHTTINSAPSFRIYKTSADLTGSATTLLPGDTLRYTITVANIGTEDAINALLKDQIPANTTYVNGSTTLNGTAVADPSTGVSALQNGMLIKSPSATTAGSLPADSTASATNVATITFDVTINAGVISGTVISNQGFLTGDGAGGTAFNEAPSDDPGTTVLNDPTLDVIGNVPLIDAVKTVALTYDANGNNEVDAGDYLTYTITVTNYGPVQATGVILTDAIPANTSYRGGTTTLNTIAVPDPSLNVSALQSGMPISSSDLTPPLPTVGYLSPGGTATITFQVEVNAGVGAGVTISNQGFVASNEQATEPTDADGNDTNGDQPTLIVTGNVPLLSITKQVSVVGGGAALAGGKLEYVVTVTNVGTVDATGVTVSDNLDDVTPGYMTYDGTVPATLNGSTIPVTTTATTVNADYSTTYGNLRPGQSFTLRFRVDLNAGLAIGTTVTNRAYTNWDTTYSANAEVSVSIGGTPGSAALNGKVWLDANFNKAFDTGENQLANWTVNLYYKSALVASTVSDANGDYRFTGLAPNNMVADRYEVRFVAPGAGANTAKLGWADSTTSNSTYLPFTDGLQYISNIVVKSGDSVTNLNLPITPNGVIYNSLARTPVSGATLTLLNATSGQPLDATCFEDPAQQNQVTLADGYYKFDLTFAGGNCPAGGNYVIHVTPPTGFIDAPSVVIPPQTGPYDVPTCPAPGTLTNGYCEMQTFSGAPAQAYAAGSAQTNYYLSLTLNNPSPGSNQIYHNPIPVDPDLANALNVTKISDKVNVTRGELVPYTITVRNDLLITLNNLTIYDNFPAGFKYVPGSARFNGAAMEPTRNGNLLSWTTNIVPGTTYTIKLLLVVGSGVHEGKYVNRAYVYSPLTNNYSETATATVRVVPDATFDCSDIVGKVYDDKNLNGYQDKGEKGLGGVRLATARGLLITTDPHGRFHLTCAAVPNEDRGSNFIIKLDERSLPTGYRVTTENPRVRRLTRGKAISFNFGATLHHVVTMDIADGVFEQNSDALRDQWKPRLGLLITQLRKAPSVLRLTYLADKEDKSLVKDRIAAIKDRILSQWKDVGNYELTIETEIFWRHGGPVDEGDFLP